MLDDPLDLYISRGIPLHERLRTSCCLSWDYFQSIYDLWLRDQYLKYLVLNSDEV